MRGLIAKLKLFFRSNKRLVLGSGGGLILLGMVLFIVLGGFGSSLDSLIREGRTEEALAEYARMMEAKPTAATAQKMLDLSLEAKKRSLLYTTLKDYIHPWLDVPGVLEVFTQGAKEYIRSGSLNDEGVLWLAQEKRLTTDTEINDLLAQKYNLVQGRVNQVQLGNQLLSLWPLNQNARSTYIAALGTIMGEQFPASPQDYPEKSLLEGFPAALANDPAMGHVPEFIRLWLWAWKGNLTPEFVQSLDALADKPDNLGIYWTLRGAALLQGLEAGWNQSLGLDVAREAEAILQQIPDPHRRRVLEGLYEKVDPMNKAQTHIYIGFILKPWAEERWGRPALELLLTSAGVKLPLPYSTQDGELFILRTPNSPTVKLERGAQELLVKLRERFGQNQEFIDLDRVLRLNMLQGNPMKLHRQQLLGSGLVQHSLTQPALLLINDGQVTHVKLLNGQTKPLGSVTTAWAPDGREFVTLSFAQNRAVFKIYSALGDLTEEFSLSGIPASQMDQDTTATAFVNWIRPDTMLINYSTGSYHEGDGLTGYSINRQAQKATSYPQSESPGSWSFLPGLGLYYDYSQGRLVDGAGHLVSPVVTQQSRVQFAPEASEIYIQDEKLYFKNSQGTKLLSQGDFSSSIPWYARLDGKVYLASYSRLYVLDPMNGDFAIVKGGFWHELAPVTNQAIGYNGLSNLHTLYHDFFAEEVAESTWSIGGRDLPISFLNRALFAAYKTGSSVYIVVIDQGDISPSYEGKIWLLEFR